MASNYSSMSAQDQQGKMHLDNKDFNKEIKEKVTAHLQKFTNTV